MSALLWLVLIASVALIAYHLAVYPMVLEWAARTYGKDPDQAAPPAMWPDVTIIIPAYNEAAIIARKIENLSAIDYPRDKLHVRLALDGCRDQTESLARAAALGEGSGLDLTIVSYTRNIGKVAVLNDQIAAVTSPVVALSDASAFFAPDAIKKAVAHFTDAHVGVVFPTYRLLVSGSVGEQVYINYLTKVKALETRLDSAIGGHGALYLFRRALWQPLPADTINDDYILPLRIVAQGYRGIYDTGIVAVEMETTHAVQEFRRRMRLSAGNMQQTLALLKLADPRRFWLAFMFVSGKGMRPFVPLLAAAAGLAAYLLAAMNSTVLGVLATLGLAAAAVLTVKVRQLHGAPRLLLKIGYILEGLAASFIGTAKFLLGLKAGQWQRSKWDQADRVAAKIVYQSEAVASRS
jgi:cellulose synthase/poly-beta-1,6-N-acetylglucosamine synthase-like glycosyltransferase